MTDQSQLGSLEPYAPGFAARLAELGYRPWVISWHLQVMADLGWWMTCNQLDVASLTPAVVAQFVADRRSRGKKQPASAAGMEPLLGYLRDQMAIPVSAQVTPRTAVEMLLTQYERFLAREQGLTSESIKNVVRLVRPFLHERAAQSPDETMDLERLTTAEITNFMLTQCRVRTPTQLRALVGAMRSMLRFLHLTGVIAVPLAGAVPSAASHHFADLPRYLEPEQVATLLEACDLSDPAGRRNFAILTLLSRLGLRCGDVAGLSLEDIDWRHGEIILRGKGNRWDRLPLPTDVGEAIAGYLRDGRPVTALERRVFIRLRAPHRGLTSTAITQLVARTAIAAGLGTIYGHRLRHSAATGMLRSGGSLAEVGQVLRHASPVTTAQYAKVDIAALAALARPWPIAETAGTR